MDKQLIHISEDVIAFVVRPISLFLNDVEAGSVLTHIALPKSEGKYGIVSKGTGADKKTSYPTFKFSSSKGGIYKFTLYDLRNFSNNGIAFNDYFIPETGKDLCLQESFTVSSCKPLLDKDGNKIYPLFCYTGYEEYTKAKLELPEGSYPSDDMLTELKESGVKDSAIDKYYRIVDIDKPIFYYPDAIAKKGK